MARGANEVRGVGFTGTALTTVLLYDLFCLERCPVFVLALRDGGASSLCAFPALLGIFAHAHATCVWCKIVFIYAAI